MQSIQIKKKHSFLLNMRKYGMFYLLALPGLIYLLVFHYGPMVGIMMAFTEFKPMQGFMGIFNGKWVGLKYFDSGTKPAPASCRTSRR